MRLLIFALALITATPAPGNSVTGTGSKDATKSIDGTWQCISLVGFEGQAPDEILKKFKIKFVGTRATITKGDKTFTAKVKTDFTKKPAEIDMVLENGPAKGQVYLGLFALKNSELTIQFGYPGLKRPGWMESGKIHILMVLKRIK